MRNDPSLIALQAHELRASEQIETPGTVESFAALAAFVDATRDLADALSKEMSTETFCELVAARLRALSGYDRVMICRFDPEWNGEVIAEARRDDLAPHLGQHYPATDIPPQARELDLRNRVWVVHDTKADLRNMGVQATMVASILHEGALWGLICCHHLTPGSLAPEWSVMADGFARLITAQIPLTAARHRAHELAAAQSHLRSLTRTLGTHAQLGPALVAEEAGMMTLMNASGLAVLHRDVLFTCGTVPSHEDIRRIIGRIERDGVQQFITDRLGEEAPDFVALAGVAAGVLALHIPHTRQGWILWFRPEQSRDITWAGDPSKGAARTSFAARQTAVRGRSRAWTTGERAIVSEVVRPNLIEVMAAVYQQQSDELRRYHSILFKQVHDAVIVSDLDGRITFWNDGAAQVLGWTATEMVGRHVLDRVPEAQHTGASVLFSEALAGRPYVGRYQDTHKNGTAVWLDIRLMRINDEAERPFGVMGISRDVTAQKLAEDRLRLERDIVRHARDAILVTEANSLDSPSPRIVYANQALARDTGYTPEELVGQTPRIFQGPRTDRAALARIRAALARAEPVHEVLINYRKDGSSFDVEIEISPLFDESGAVSHFVAVQRDISERQRVEAQRLHLEDLLRQSQKMEALGQLASGMAHDFNNILTVIISIAELLAIQIAPDAPHRGLVDDLKGIGEQGTGLTRQLLAFSRKQVVRHEMFVPNEVIDAMSRMLTRLLGTSVRFALDLAPNLWPVMADRGQIEQVIMNLVINARDAMPNGGSLLIKTENTESDAGQFVRLTVSDTGTGMTNEVKERLFEPFFTTKEKGRGTGLGLSTVYWLVQQARGVITFDSTVGRGTTMQVDLPRAEAEPVARSGDPPSLAAWGTETLLLVEDDDVLRGLTAQLLRYAGYQVIAAANGIEALTAHEHHAEAITLVLTDLVMPGLNGRDLAEPLLARDPGLKIVYMSGCIDDTELRRGIEQDHLPLLHKPFSAEELIRVVRSALDSRTAKSHEILRASLTGDTDNDRYADSDGYAESRGPVTQQSRPHG